MAINKLQMVSATVTLAVVVRNLAAAITSPRARTNIVTKAETTKAQRVATQVVAAASKFIPFTDNVLQVSFLTIIFS